MEQQQITFDYSYKVHLRDFEGPLDLLLHLIKESKIDIKQIFVSEVTRQYLEYMEQLDTVDLERASEFLETAATLLEIKSKSLLPKEEELMPDTVDAEADLIRRLEEYKLIKEASEKMQLLENVDRFYKAPDESVNDYRFILKAMTLEGLLNAFSGMLHKVEKEKLPVAPKEIRKDRFTVAEKTAHIRDLLYERRTVSFFDLFDSESTRSEIINTFLALLELLKMQFAYAQQNELFDDIVIVYVEMEGN